VPEEYVKPYAHLRGNRRIYAGMLAAMDEAIGQIIGAIEKKGLRDNTLIVFCSDNGGPAPGVVTSNGPLRAGKGTLYEGGVRVPAVAVWPGRIKAGSIVRAPLHIVDWYPTLVRLAGASLAQPLPLDGRDAWPAIAEGAASPHDDVLINISLTGGAVRAGDWKLVVNGQDRDTEEGGEGTAAQKKGGKKKAAAKSAKSESRFELFNLQDDPYEKSNLAEKNPEMLSKLRARLDAYAKAAVPSKQAPRAADYKVPAVWGEQE
jgi:arylsulfatase A-like enzyme